MMAEKASLSKSKRLLAILGKKPKSESSLSSAIPISTLEPTSLAASSASSPPRIPTLQPHKQTILEAPSSVGQIRVGKQPNPPFIFEKALSETGPSHVQIASPHNPCSNIPLPTPQY